jgi:hypothetical protein
MGRIDHASKGGQGPGIRKESQMPNPKYAAYRSAAPYFDLVREALGALVDGERQSIPDKRYES